MAAHNSALTNRFFPGRPHRTPFFYVPSMVDTLDVQVFFTT